jgi:hypothetical protein
MNVVPLEATHCLISVVSNNSMAGARTSAVEATVAPLNIDPEIVYANRSSRNVQISSR